MAARCQKSGFPFRRLVCRRESIPKSPAASPQSSLCSATSGDCGAAVRRRRLGAGRRCCPVQAPAKQIASQGSLVLHVKPDNTDVFVDGYYVGAAVDLGGDRGGTFLEEGPHRVDLSAPGFESVTFDVRIAPNQSIVFRRELKPIQRATAGAAESQRANDVLFDPRMLRGQRSTERCATALHLRHQPHSCRSELTRILIHSAIVFCFSSYTAACLCFASRPATLNE